MSDSPKQSRFVAVVRNIFSNRLHQEAVGYETTADAFTIRHEEMLAYAKACEDNNPVYEKEEEIPVVPLFASRILAGVLEECILHKKLGINLLKMVHAEQSLTFEKPLFVGDTVVPWACIEAVRQVSSGWLVDINLRLLRDEEPVVTGVASMFMRGNGTGQKSLKKDDDVPQLTEVQRFTVLHDQPQRYARASGDWNPIHTKKWVAKLAGFGAPIAHGLCVMGMTAGVLVDRFADGDPTALRHIGLRFSKPAYPGKELVLRAGEDEAGIHFVLENHKGKPVLSRGVFRCNKQD